jgi:plastocyanin
MRKLPAAVLALTAGASLLGGAVAAGASAPTGGKPPVKIDGKVNGHGTAKVKGDAVGIDADDFYFEKTYLKGKAGKTVGVTITNEGAVDHTFTIDAQGVDEELAPGDSIDVDVTIPDDGKPAVFYCRFHKASGMQGALFSKKGAKPSSGASGGTGGTTATSSGGGGGYGY